jgi:hypothetical protein
VAGIDVILSLSLSLSHTTRRTPPYCGLKVTVLQGHRCRVGSAVINVLLEVN